MSEGWRPTRLPWTAAAATAVCFLLGLWVLLNGDPGSRIPLSLIFFGTGALGIGTYWLVQRRARPSGAPPTLHETRTFRYDRLRIAFAALIFVALGAAMLMGAILGGGSVPWAALFVGVIGAGTLALGASAGLSLARRHELIADPDMLRVRQGWSAVDVPWGAIASVELSESSVPLATAADGIPIFGGNVARQSLTIRIRDDVEIYSQYGPLRRRTRSIALTDVGLDDPEGLRDLVLKRWRYANSARS